MERFGHIDAARGTLLVGMLAVHLVSRHTTAEALWMQQWVGIFLISAGFVAVSGMVHGLKPSRPGNWLQALDSCLHLLVVMVTYAVLISLTHHFVGVLAKTPEACYARYGWTPPLRLDDLGILLPLALVRLLSPLVSLPRTVALSLLIPLCFAGMFLPGAENLSDRDGAIGWLSGVLFARTLTPFYTVSYFVAFGLLGAITARWIRRAVVSTPESRTRRAGWLLLACFLAFPKVSQGVLGLAYETAGKPLGSALTLVYWSMAILAFLRAFGPGHGPGRLRTTLERFGRYSLVVFVTHGFLMVANDLLCVVFGADKGLGTAAALFLFDFVVLFAVVSLIEARPAARRVIQYLLLATAPRGRMNRSSIVSVSGAIAISLVLTVYVGYAAKGPRVELIIDEFQSGNDCPAWWSFGTLTFDRSTDDAGDGSTQNYYLTVRGSAEGLFANGCGVTLTRDIGERRTLALDVRGYGPDSGRIKVELCEDDNGNWVVEKDPYLYTPLYDDRWVYEFTVDWSGWRQLSIPLALFNDDNPQGGNNIFDPTRDLTSGGLIELQMLFSPTPGARNQVQIDIDNLRWLP